MKKPGNLLTQPISRRAFLIGSLGVFAIGGVGFGKGYANTASNEIVLEKVDIHLKRLPASFKGLTLGQLSDLHSSPIAKQDALRRGAEMIMAEKPDVIVLTGDFIGNSIRVFAGEIHESEPIYVDELVKSFAGLKAPMGIYAVPGNHDFWSGPQALEYLIQEMESKLGVQWLRNRSVVFERGADKLVLVGVDDYWEDTCSLKTALEGTPEDTARILLSHNPDINETLYDWSKIDLIISGHTHGGQIKFPFIGPPFKPGITHQKYLEGLVRDGDRQTYITRGLGHLLVPLRFNCPPEVTLLTLV